MKKLTQKLNRDFQIYTTQYTNQSQLCMLLQRMHIKNHYEIIALGNKVENVVSDIIKF